jgi:hypothetical protein
MDRFTRDLIMPKRIELNKALRSALLRRDSMPDDVVVAGQRYSLQSPLRAGYKGVVWRVTDEYARQRVAKFAIYKDYEDRSFLQEMTRAAQLERYPQFARIDGASLVDLSIPGHGVQRFVCFIEQWIDGVTLADFVVKYRESVTCLFMVGYIKSFCDALSALAAVRLRHDDLHSGNVMLEHPAPGMSSDDWRVKVIDMGSLKSLDVPSKKEKDDHRHFVDHIIEIHNTICRKRPLQGREQRFLKEAKGLIRSMLDDDATTSLREPGQVASQFEYAYARASSPRAQSYPTLQAPFEYISAEHMVDDRLLVDIFADSCPWLEKVSGPDPCLVTGPRGCGKSTIFRWLSLKAHLHKPDLDAHGLRIAGFYVSCSSDLQNRLGWLRTAALAERFRREIVHYFNLFLAREVVHTLCLIQGRPDAQGAWGLGEPQEQAVHEFLRRALDVSRPSLQGASRLRQALEILESEMFACHVQMLKGVPIEWATPETFLGDLTTLLRREISFFREHPIAFLLDDYSTHRLPDSVQIVLNRVIWERRGTHVFKLSSEKYGATLTDSFHATVDVSREMVEVDCGREYIALDDTDQVERARRFAKDLLVNRLRAAKYAGTADGLLGSSEWPDASLGRALRERPHGRLDDQYHGLECIADLCSGDVSTLLLAYRRIFEKGKVERNSGNRVPKRTQHEAIESVSRELLDAIRHHFPHGPAMYTIVQAFGTLVRRILREGRLIKKADSRVPPQCPRIEVDHDSVSPEERLNPEQENLNRELVRRAVFIEMEPGRSRHRFVTTLRWQLRRVYLPAFGAALSKNDAVKWKPSDFKYFLIDPQGACQREWQRRPKEDGTGAQAELEFG